MGSEGTGKPAALPIELLATELIVDSIEAEEDMFDPVGTLFDMATREGGCVAVAVAGEADVEEEIALIWV